MNFAVIPVRMASTRFPGKFVYNICGIPMLTRVYNAVVTHPMLDGVCVAHPKFDRAIDSVCAVDAIPHVGTLKNHPTGSDRVFEACQRLGIKRGIIVNVQGDEPLIAHTHISQILGMFSDPKVQVATLARKVAHGEGDDSDCVKVRFDGTMRVFDFTRSFGDYVCMGLMAYRFFALADFARAFQADAEKRKSVELQRCLDLDIPVHVGITTVATVGVDREEHAKRVEKILEGG